MAEKKYTPMMQHYLKMKEENPDAILFYRLGDFYEMFFDDAKLVSQELDLVLTGRSAGVEEKVPMCGVPFHAANSYISRLVKKGYKVAICEQLELIWIQLWMPKLQTTWHRVIFLVLKLQWFIVN